MSTPRQIPFFDYPALFAELEPEIMSAVRDVFARGAYIMQSDLLNFEAELASYLGVRHAIGVADGTMGLLLPLLALELQPGDEVIVPSHTFVASAAAIHHAGGKPVLADCGRDHLIDPQSVRRLLTKRTRGIMPVQLNGRTADMDALGAIARVPGARLEVQRALRRHVRRGGVDQLLSVEDARLLRRRRRGHHR
jgi:dTDP-4-amino-4,6-dideoxygalactose transaminase